MSLFEAGLRGGAVAVLLLVASLFLRDQGRSPAGRNCALSLLSAAAYVVCSAPGFARLETPLGLSLLMVSLGAPVLIWTAAAAVFDDAFKPSWQRPVAWFGLVVLGMWSILDSQPLVDLTYYSLCLLFVGLSAWHALAGSETDLVESRRRLRMLVVVSNAAYAGAIIVADQVSPGSSISAPFSIINAVGLAAIAFAFAVSWLAIVRDAPFIVPANSARSSPRTDAGADRAATVSPAEEQEKALLQALRELMEDQKFYRHEGLSIAVLAARLAIPEYRLRRLINQQLGHRNFSSFINGYRLADARAALGDPIQAEVPILTIALDAGFQSLAPFNRAFKVTTGMTPSAYRRQCLSPLHPTFVG